VSKHSVRYLPNHCIQLTVKATRVFVQKWSDSDCTKTRVALTAADAVRSPGRWNRWSIFREYSTQKRSRYDKHTRISDVLVAAV